MRMLETAIIVASSAALFASCAKSPAAGEESLPAAVASGLPAAAAGSPVAASAAPHRAPATAAPAAVGEDISLVPGLTIVTAVHGPPHGDYESLKRILEVDEKGYLIAYSADLPAVEEGLGGLAALLDAGASAQPKGPPRAEKVRSQRRVLAADRLSAREYMQYFGEEVPANVPGTTAIGVSRDVLSDLMAGRATEITMHDVSPFGRIGSGISSLLRDMAGDLAGLIDTSELEAMDRISGTLERVSDAPGAFPLLLNGTPTTVPSVTARGTLGEQPVELVLLAQPDNPIALSWRIGEQNDLRVVQIRFPAAPAAGESSSGMGAPVEAIERQLADTGRAAVYGIYFDFASDRIKPESEPVVREIAAALTRHPDWRLAVEGHTDSMGDDASNRELSQRRAAAVKTALVDRHGIAPARLATAGFGESRPKATNDTLEGRAQNRRVELVRDGT